jgi:hypothetical protein
MSEDTNAVDHSGSVGIVVVNWNGYDDTAACLASLREVDYPDYRVVVVDNGSTDGSGSRLADEFRWCEFVFNETNQGFGGGCNSGIEAALSAGCDYVLLLNPDARLEAGSLSELVAVERASGAGVVGATITHGDGEGAAVNPAPSRFPDMLFYSGYRTNLPVDVDSAERYEDRRWFETDRVEGAGVLLASELLRERQRTVGYYLDDSLFMYCEEVELAMWCREHGRRSVIATEALVDHDSAASSSRSFQLYYLTRNRVLIAHRYFELGERLAFDALYPVTRLALAGRWVRRGRRATAMAVLRGLIDGYRHVDGRTR